MSSATGEACASVQALHEGVLRLKLNPELKGDADGAVLDIRSDQ